MLDPFLSEIWIALIRWAVEPVSSFSKAWRHFLLVIVPSFPPSQPTHQVIISVQLKKKFLIFFSDYIEICSIGPLSFRETEQMEEEKLLTKISHLIDWAITKEI